MHYFTVTVIQQQGNDFSPFKEETQSAPYSEAFKNSPATQKQTCSSKTNVTCHVSELKRLHTLDM